MALGQRTPTPISRGEFGVIGVERILRLLARHQIRATFFIPGITLNTYPDVCRDIAEQGHEIAHHGFTHVSPVNMNRDEERQALLEGNRAIKEITGLNARGYRSPAWDLSPNSVELLVEQGFLYDSSMMAHDSMPYHARTGDQVQEKEIRFGDSTPLVELPVSWNLDDFPHFEYFRGGGLKNADLVMENWLDDFRFMTLDTQWGVLTYTFHPFVIGRGHRMLMLDRFILGLTELGAQFVTAEAAVEEFDPTGSSGPTGSS
jgi:peptidoglycan/xylan/chitin deacetylase (PgdA/CDA1 family)